jgi:hypothetical protein
VKRRLFNLLVAGSLLLFIITLALWVRSYWQGTWLTITHECLNEKGYLRASRWIVSECGAIALQSERFDDDGRAPRSLGYVPDKQGSVRFDELPPMHPTLRFAMSRYGWFRHFAGFSLYHRQNKTSWSPATGYNWPTITTRFSIVIPHWFIVGVLAVLPAWWLIRRRNARRARRAGLCANCGYDLRATPDRCPECGQPAA